MTSILEPRPKAVLVGVQFSSVSEQEHEASLAELTRLVTTMGYDVVGVVSQRRDSLASAAVLGEGKLKELAEYTDGTGVVPSYSKDRVSKARERFEATDTSEDDASDLDEYDPDAPEEADGFEQMGSSSAEEPNQRQFDGARPSLVVVDHEITPRQARNLERATGVEVLDRTGVIVKIFHRHAQSREARLQVEIARLKYVVMDASDPTCDEQLAVTRSVLGEIGADAVPHLLVLNKADRLSAEERLEIVNRHADGILLSARDASDIWALRQRIIEHFEAVMRDEELFIRLLVRAMPAEMARLRQIFAA